MTYDQDGNPIFSENINLRFAFWKSDRGESRHARTQCPDFRLYKDDKENRRRNPLACLDNFCKLTF